MSAAEQGILHLIRFADMSKWSANVPIFDGVKTSYPLCQLSRVLKRIKEPTIIEDDRLYKRITVRLYGQGVLQRDEVLGKDIGTKRQFVAHAGQLIISRIDARNGAFGIVPDELEGAIVTNDFWLFEVHDALPQYLMLVMASDLFQKYWQTQSSGTTNRQRVGEDDFLQSKIVLPAIPEQQALLEAYNASMKKADEVEKKRENLFTELNNHIFETLGISFTSIRAEGLLNTIEFKRISRWDPAHLKDKVFVSSKYPLTAISNVLANFMVDRNGQSLRRSTSAETNSTYQYIGMEHIEKGTGKRKNKEVLGTDILSQTIYVPQGYIIYGKLRPYLNKYWENNTEENNIICSSEFFVFDIQNINKDYFITILASDIVQKQLPPLYSGARMPRINEDDFSGLQIPLPPKNIQIEIAEYSNAVKEKSEALRAEAESLRQRAKKEFEEAVFGGI